MTFAEELKQALRHQPGVAADADSHGDQEQQIVGVVVADHPDREVDPDRQKHRQHQHYGAKPDKDVTRAGSQKLDPQPDASEQHAHDDEVGGGPWKSQDSRKREEQDDEPPTPDPPGIEEGSPVHGLLIGHGKHP